MVSSLLPMAASEIFQWAAWIVVLYLLFLVCSLYLKRMRLQRAFSCFPGPETHWLYGNTHVFKRDGNDFNIFEDYAKKYNYAFPLWLGSFFATLTICHPDYAKALLSRQDPKDNFIYYFLTEWFGKGLLVLAGEKWHQHRRMLTPGFHYDILKPYVKVMSDSVNILLDKWEQLISDNKSVELFQYLSVMTLDTFMKCSFGYESNCQLDSENEYIKAVSELCFLVDLRFNRFPYYIDFIFNLSPYGFRFRRALKIAHKHTENVIKQRKESLMQETELEKIKQKRQLDFLDILLCSQPPRSSPERQQAILKWDENGQRLSDADLRAEADTFMFEGHDTTASGISWILYCMAKYPEHQKKCREEIMEVLGDRDTVEWDDLGKMPYCTMCIKESLRLYPPAPLIARQLTSPITFPDGRSLPKGIIVFVSIYNVNRCPDTWDDPKVFDPLRFSLENSSKRHSHAFVTFSAGSRNCIGQNFAMNEMKVALALTLKRFELSPANKPKKVFQIVLRSVNGIHLYLKKLPQRR